MNKYSEQNEISGECNAATGVHVQSGRTREEENAYAAARAHIAYRISVVSIVVNLLLTVFKLTAGIVAHSMAMVSDAVHSASDVFSTVIVILGVKIGGKASDTNHPYGHERFECVAAVVLAVVLAGTGCVLGYGGVRTLVRGKYDALPTPGVLALVAACVSIAVKEGMFWYTRAGAKKINSSALKADAWHHRSDALSSVGAFAGILGAKLGVPVLDPVASLLICALILKASVDIFIDAVRKMTDEACDSQTVERIDAVIRSQDGVDDVDKILTRKFGDRIYVEAEISVNGDLPLRAAHDIARAVHYAIEAGLPQVKHCTVHVNPSDHTIEDIEE